MTVWGLCNASESYSIVPSIAPRRVDSGRQRDWNPLAADPVTATDSSYLGSQDGVRKHLLDPEEPPGEAKIAVHDELVNKVLGEGFPCVGARSAFNRRVYRFGQDSEIGAEDAAVEDNWRCPFQPVDPNRAG
jgi:hypothetical protein